MKYAAAPVNVMFQWKQAVPMWMVLYVTVCVEIEDYFTAYFDGHCSIAELLAAWDTHLLHRCENLIHL